MSPTSSSSKPTTTRGPGSAPESPNEGHIPSTSELCLLAHVCERRLRGAFVATYGIPPTRFFRLWALDRARNRLVVADPTQDTVTQVAVGLGFAHVGLRVKNSYQPAHR